MKKFLDFKLIEFGNYTFTVTNLLTVIFIFVATKFLLWVIKRVYEKRFSKIRDERGRKYAHIQLTGYFLWTFSIILMIQGAGFNITLLLAGSAALLVGIGLGLQQTFNDFISGFILLIDKTIQVNDVVEINDIVARVDHIGIRTSVLVNRDDISIIVPNSKITGANVINWSHIKKQSRFYLPVGVAYGSDEELVRTVLLECVSQHSLVLKNPEPFVRLEEFGNSSVDFKIYFWTSEIFGVENIKSELRFSIIKKLREHNISIPFPQMDVHVKEIPGVK
jgi:small-conductance mechanosensitive channel